MLLFLFFLFKLSCFVIIFFFFSSRRRHTRWNCDWSSDVCSSDLGVDVARGVVDGWLLARLDVLRHVGVTRRADLNAEFVLLYVGTGLGRGDRRPFEADERLVDVVVGIAEVDALGPRRGEGDLVDIEVEALRARLERLLEGDDDPVDVALL